MLALTGTPFNLMAQIGLLILIGVVVNNAILIVHQSLNNIRGQAMTPRQAIVESVRSRIRPIYMSSITTVSAMLPLVLAPGAGSEFYRGLGSVVVGGLLVSTVFTLSDSRSAISPLRYPSATSSNTWVRCSLSLC